MNEINQIELLHKLPQNEELYKVRANIMEILIEKLQAAFRGQIIRERSHVPKRVPSRFAKVERYVAYHLA